MAGSQHGSAKTVAELEAIAAGVGRPVRQRTTTYGVPARAPAALPAAPWPDRARADSHGGSRSVSRSLPVGGRLGPTGPLTWACRLPCNSTHVVRDAGSRASRPGPRLHAGGGPGPGSRRARDERGDAGARSLRRHGPGLTARSHEADRMADPGRGRGSAAVFASAEVVAAMVDPAEAELSWQERALCAQTDPESFFPEKGGSTREAKKVCTGLRGPGRVPGVRPRPRRALRHLGRAVRARAPAAEEGRGLGPPGPADRGPSPDRGGSARSGLVGNVQVRRVR